MCLNECHHGMACLGHVLLAVCMRPRHPAAGPHHAPFNLPFPALCEQPVINVPTHPLPSNLCCSWAKMKPTDKRGTYISDAPIFFTNLVAPSLGRNAVVRYSRENVVYYFRQVSHSLAILSVWVLCVWCTTSGR